MGMSQGIIAAFSEEQTERLTGVTKRQLRYWDSTSFYTPSYAEENRRVAFSRVYSFKDLVALRVLNTLRNQHKVSLQSLREVRDKLNFLESDPDKWTGIRLYVLNKRVVWHEPETDLPQEVLSGQYVAKVLVLDEVVADTRNKIEELKAPRKREQFGSIEKSRYVVHNVPVIAGTRIPVNAIKRFSDAGYTVEQILKEYPDLTEQDISAALKYREPSSAA